MQPIDAGVVLFFQFIWLAIVFLILWRVVKLKNKITEYRSALAPFARIYENDPQKREISYIFKRAFEVFTQNS